MKVFENLVRWQNYVHYFLLTLGITIFVTKFGVEATTFFFRYTHLPNLNFLWLYLFIFGVDTLVHITFSILPGKWKWSD